MVKTDTTRLESAERWAEIPGYNGTYSVSSNGRIRNNRTGRLMKPGVCNGNHWYATINLSSGGRSRSHKVHRLVATAFIENPFGYPQINHINSVRSDNAVGNLEWCNNTHNMRHAAALGHLGSKGEKHHKAKLGERDVFAAENMMNQGICQHEIARRLGVSRSAISLISAGITWRHLKLDRSNFPNVGRRPAEIARHNAA